MSLGSVSDGTPPSAHIFSDSGSETSSPLPQRPRGLTTPFFFSVKIGAHVHTKDNGQVIAYRASGKAATNLSKVVVGGAMKDVPARKELSLADVKEVVAGAMQGLAPYQHE